MSNFHNKKPPFYLGTKISKLYFNAKQQKKKEEMHFFMHFLFSLRFPELFLILILVHTVLQSSQMQPVLNETSKSMLFP